MSDKDRKSDGTVPEPNGRTLGKYRIINNDDMPCLHEEEERAEGRGRARGSFQESDGRTETPEQREERRKKRSAGQKGSCPSWLKSRVYKGSRPGEDDKGLVELQELIIRHSPVGTLVLDNRGRVRIRNDSFTDVLEVDSDAPLDDIDDLAQMIEGVNLCDRFWDAVETGSKVEVEEEIRIGGEPRGRVRVEFHPVSLPSGMSWCICYFSSVSDGSAPSGAMYEYQRYVARLTASSGDAIVGLDIDGTIKYWNQGAEALFGYTNEEITGKNVMVLVPEELRREAQLVLKVVREKGIYRNFDTHRLNKSGQSIPVAMTVSAVRDEDGKLIGTAATCKDLRATKDLHEKALEAERLNAVLQMAVSVYHKINDPLCVIAANSQLLMPRLDGLGEDAVQKLRTILDATKRINKVLEDLTRLTGAEPQSSMSGANPEASHSGEEEDPAA